ncbi:hypothetical protein EVAR_80412_1 [Eumeta japonica]|uniref:Uncharacterized protein n=1 Tax=Eumeta variegata TaxID=151549 RepID=A0A4C1VHS2_EUMVA|nr:hypothetical protein EVAR_80412_1 [Eumeta japonica]
MEVHLDDRSITLNSMILENTRIVRFHGEETAEVIFRIDVRKMKTIGCKIELQRRRGRERSPSRAPMNRSATYDVRGDVVDFCNGRPAPVAVGGAHARSFTGLDITRADSANLSKDGLAQPPMRSTLRRLRGARGAAGPRVPVGVTAQVYARRANGPLFKLAH